MNSGSDGSSAGGLFSLGKAQTVEVKTLNAKKLDINFDNDDFFNSFQPTQNNQSGIKTQQSTSLQDVPDLFDLTKKPQNQMSTAKSSISFNKQSSNISNPSNNDAELEAQQRLRAMGNRKGISSEDVFGRKDEKSEEDRQRYAQLAGAKAISSDMFFGKAEGGGSGDKNFGDDVEGYILGRSSLNSNNSYDEYKEAATVIAEKVTQSARQLKDKALDWLSTF